MKKISSGAEAEIFKEKNIIKDRVKKGYRIKEIDLSLRKSRTKRESKILIRLEKINFPAPRIIKTDNESKIEMEFIVGNKVRDILENNPIKLSKEIGEKLAILHNNDIYHGDLTTSNMIFYKKIYFIDFGLSLFSDKVEDKAVDIHLFRQALESKHDKIWEKCYKSFLIEYQKKVKNNTQIMNRLEKIEKRGRNK